MLKRLTALLLIMTVVLCASAAMAELNQLPLSCFDNSKNALYYMSQKNYEQAINTLNASSWLNAAALKQTVDTGCPSLYNISVQTEYAVALKVSGKLYLAVPITEPADGYVDAIVYSLNSEYDFTGLRFVKWAEVERQLGICEACIWREPYSPAYRVFED